MYMKYIIIDGLRPLYKEMMKAEQYRRKFTFGFRNVKSDVLYLIDTVPNILMFGVVNKNIYFELQVEKGFVVTLPLAPDVYRQICDAFEIKFSPNHHFQPSEFLSHLNKHIPQGLDNTTAVRPVEITPYRTIPEEADKIYFCGFARHTERHFTHKNLRKTRMLLGEKAYQRCEAANISSCWTDHPVKDTFDTWKEQLEKKLKA